MSTSSGSKAAARKRSAESSEFAEITRDKKKKMLPETTTDKGKNNLMSAEITTDKKSTEIARDKRQKMSAEIATDKGKKMSAEITTDKGKNQFAENNTADEEKKSSSAEITTDKRKEESAKSKEKKESSADGNTDKGKNSTTGEEFEFFFGKSSPFSQHHPAAFVIDGVTYNCAEQYMMHQKAVLFKDEAMARNIMASSNPVEQKRFGRKVRNFDKERWAQRSKQVVRLASRAKFWQNPKLLETLLATHPRTLVEAAPRDRLWGIGLGASNPKARNRSQWRGRNLLGEILTEVRAELRLKGRAIMDFPVPVSRD